jgi:hypothetical protein
MVFALMAGKYILLYENNKKANIYYKYAKEGKSI